MSEIPVADRARIAAGVRLSEQYLYQCLTGRRKTPLEHCAPIERESAGRITCEQLRPDQAWIRVADPLWPWHSEGRPLLDAARMGVRGADESAALAASA